MRKQFLVFYLLIMSFSGAFSAGPEKYDWEENRKRIELTGEDLKAPAVVLKDKRVIEYIFVPGKGGTEEFTTYKTYHKIIRVNTDEAIDQYNKVYIQIEDENSLVSIKARSINKAGKITLFDKKNLKEVTSEELSMFKIFAIEGLDPGSEIEYIYTVRRGINVFGREILQSSIPSKNINLSIISPEHLEFDAKGYNNLPAFTDTILDGKRFIDLKVDNIIAEVDEEYAVTDANSKRVDYKLAYNHDRGKARMYTWAEAAERIFTQNCVFNSSEISKVKKLVKAQKFASLSKDEEKIRAVENYIKSNFVLRNGADDNFRLVDKIIANKYGDEIGFTRLFESILSELNIDRRLVLTTDRSDVRFDGKFDTWNYLDKVVFYFPTIDKYLAPSVAETRLDMIPFYWTNNEGLFIKKVKIGDTETSVGEVKFINPLSSESSPDNIYADVEVLDDMESVKLHVKKVMGGYNAVMFQPFYKMLDTEKQQQLNDDLMSFISKDATVTNIKVQNIDPNVSLVEKPFAIEGDMTLTSLIEKAGNKYIFKVGDIIGRQSELYSEKKRINPVENDFNRVYMREIKVKIPEGYTIKNPQDIKIKVLCDLDGEKAAGFISDYKLNGNILTISINEYYNKINLPLSSFENFRKVINAAADFNKVQLILEKK